MSRKDLTFLKYLKEVMYYDSTVITDWNHLLCRSDCLVSHQSVVRSGNSGSFVCFSVIKKGEIKTSYEVLN